MNFQNLELFCHDAYPVKWARLKIKNKILLAILLTVLPLIVLALFEGTFFKTTQGQPLIQDATILMRFIIAIPLFLLTPTFTGEKIKIISQCFIKCGLIRPNDMTRYCNLIESTKKLNDSRWTKLLLLILIYVIIWFALEKIIPSLPDSWRNVVTSEDKSLSLAGMWFIFISQPIYYFVVLHFLYQTLLWWRFTYHVSRFDLNIRAGHGDKTGGLSFLSLSIIAFTLPALAISTSAASGTLNLALFNAMDANEIKLTFFIVLGLCSLFFIGPLFFFMPIMNKVKKQAMLEYGVMSAAQTKRFEEKWTSGAEAPINTSLEVSDFSAVIDSIGIVGHARAMSILPFDLKALIPFLLVVLIPYLPLVAMVVPWSVLIKKILGVLL